MPNTFNNIAIIGSSGAIGHAFTKTLAAAIPESTINAFSRQTTSNKQTMRAGTSIQQHLIDYSQEDSINNAAQIASKDSPIDLVIVANGLLHNADMMPEKSLRELSAKKFQQLFEVNSILPALVAKHFLPKLTKTQTSVFAALSARVGSISDNRLGGWYAYRASKAALNMIVKTAAIEVARSNKHAVVVGLHPGTVDSNLSKPFQNNVADGQLFTPSYSTEKLYDLLITLSAEQSGKCFAWDGSEIQS